MADFELNDSAKQTVWSKDYTTEYVRKSGFSRDMKKSGAPIRVNKDLSKRAGDTVRISTYNALTGSGVAEGTRLKGNEEALGNSVVEVRVETKRNAVLINESDRYKTDLDLANIAKNALNQWHGAELRDDICDALVSIPVANAGAPDSTVLYSSASAAQKNAYNAANADRLVFGTSTSAASGTHATDLAGIAGTEVLSAAVLDYARDLAEQSSGYKINPYGTADGDYFIFYTSTAGYNQLRADPDIKAAMQYAWTRDEMSNPLFRGGDMLWNNIAIRKIPELGNIGDVGTTSATVGASFLCGADAVAVAYASMAEARRDEDDYGEEMGIAIREVRGVTKMTANLVDMGQVTVYHAV